MRARGKTISSDFAKLVTWSFKITLFKKTKQIFFRKSYAPQIGATYIVPLRADNMETTLTVIDDIIITRRDFWNIWITL